MRRSLQTLACSLFIAATASAQEAPPSFPSDLLRGKDQLFDRRSSEFGASAPESLQDESGAPLSAEALRAFQRADDGAWKVFSDDLITFEYPDHPLIRVAAIAPEDDVDWVGGAVGTTDRSFQRGYRILVGRRLPYLTIFVQEAKRFDEGLCFCGPISHTQLIPANGTLLQFSYLPAGLVKKAEALGARHRAIVLEWTHTTIPQKAYARIGRSLRLQQPGPRSRLEWTERLRRDGTDLEPAVWLEPQMTEAAVSELLGEPATRETGVWTYVREIAQADGARWQSTMRLSFMGGRLRPLPERWQEHAELKSKRGTLKWVEELVPDAIPPIPGLPGPNESQHRPGAEESREAADAFLDQRGAIADPALWERWHLAMANLFERRLGDPRVLEAVEKTFLDLRRDQTSATRVLGSAESPRLRDLVTQRAALIIAEAPERAEELPALWLEMDVATEAAKASRATALRHPAPPIRAAAVSASNNFLSEDEARAARLAALDDPAPEVRRAGADPVLWYRDQRAADLPLLRAFLAKETDNLTRGYLHNTVTDLEQESAETPSDAGAKKSSR